MNALVAVTARYYHEYDDAVTTKKQQASGEKRWGWLTLRWRSIFLFRNKERGCAGRRGEGEGEGDGGREEDAGGEEEGRGGGEGAGGCTHIMHGRRP